MDQVAGSSTPAPGPNALPFGTPGATDVAQALRFGASPLVRATALPAPAAAGAEKRRKVMHDKTNTPRIMPAPAECPAPRIRGKARSRTNAQSVGAGQRLGPNQEKLSDAAECFAVEGTVTGELGRQHWAVGVAVGVIGGRVPPGSRGGRVSAEDKKAAAEAPIEMFVLAHDSGKQAGKQAGPGGVSEHYLGRCLEKIANQMLAVPVEDGQLRSPPGDLCGLYVKNARGFMSRMRVRTLTCLMNKNRARTRHAQENSICLPQAGRDRYAIDARS
jgi:hypothetical protein